MGTSVDFNSGVVLDDAGRVLSRNGVECDPATGKPLPAVTYDDTAAKDSPLGIDLAAEPVKVEEPSERVGSREARYRAAARKAETAAAAQEARAAKLEAELAEVRVGIDRRDFEAMRDAVLERLDIPLEVAPWVKGETADEIEINARDLAKAWAPIIRAASLRPSGVRQSTKEIDAIFAAKAAREQRDGYHDAFDVTK